MTRPTIRPFQAGDEVAINEGFNRVFGLDRTLAEWHWKFAAEPEGRWVMLAVDPEGSVLAHYAAVPLRLRVDDLVVRAGQPVDVYSRPEARVGLAAAHVVVRTVEAFFAEFGGADRLSVLFGFPGERHLKLGLARLGYDQMPPQPIGTWVRPSAPSRRRWTHHQVRSGFDPAAVDELWERAARRYQVATVRNADWLRRRYTGRPGVEYRHFGVFRRGRAHAWAVVRPTAPTTAWAELVWDGEDERALAALDAAVAGLACAVGAPSVSLWLMGDATAERTFRGLGWRQQDNPERLVVVARSFDSRIDPATFPGRLYVTMGDSDLV